MIRVDLALVELGLAPSRAKAQQMIEAGDVESLSQGQWKVVKQSSLSLPSADPSLLRVKESSEILKYVSRGGLKLEAALRQLSLNVHSWRCLDLGISTGGFSDCLLQAGAAEICGFDVGHDQLHPRLKSDKRVFSLEGINIKQAAEYSAIKDWLRGGVNLCVADLSFISLISVFPFIASLLPKKSALLALVKPQFELGADHLNKAGVVKGLEAQESLVERLRQRVYAGLTDAGFNPQEFFPSALKGQDGNQEFFVYAVKN